MPTDEHRRYQREYARRWRAKHPERAKAVERSQRVKHREKRAAFGKEWRKRNPEKVREYDRRKYLKRRNVIRAKKYGVTPEEIDRLAATPACEACREPFGARTGYIDHCHKTGRIRGVLCNDCNVSLGRMRECPKKLRALARYAERCRSSPKSSKSSRAA